MNYCGSYRKLIGNAQSAMIAAIEIYNKPAFRYRDECSVIMLLNAWELALKAVLSKKKQSVYYAKRRNEPYRTLSWQDAFTKAQAYFPNGLHPLPIRRNLELLGAYRDNAVHFYNAQGFGVLVYPLAQTSVRNFRDLLHAVFGISLEDKVSWQLLPLGIHPPIDPIDYISGARRPKQGASKAVDQYLAELASAVDEVVAAGEDTGRLLTLFTVKLESTKKIEKADIVVGVTAEEEKPGPLAIVKVKDPNITHPLRTGDVVARIGNLHGKPFTTYVFYALAWRYELRDNPQYCWRATENVLTLYSHDAVAFIRTLPKGEVDAAVEGYAKHLRQRFRRRSGPET